MALQTIASARQKPKNVRWTSPLTRMSFLSCIDEFETLPRNSLVAFFANVPSGLNPIDSLMATEKMERECARATA